MSKVLVDRELLERISAERLRFEDTERVLNAAAELRPILEAQPAEAEGVERWSELKKLAEKATPGPWWVDSHGHRVSTEDGMQTVFIAADKMGPATRHPETGNLSHWPNDWDASYIVNASPDKILELIAALSAVTAERDRLQSQLAETQANDRTAMGYLHDVRQLVGGSDFPEMVRNVARMADALPGCVELIEALSPFEDDVLRKAYAAMAAKEA